ncbi:MAG TPA: SIMPL domain-containing protein [Streptosporangiaceae bacterium]|nr:SIMPL domain-containing protein [Streptosporangiaceae bacterium]
MPVTFTPSLRALAVGVTAAAVLIGAFALGSASGSPAASSREQRPPGTRTAAFTSPAGSARITVTGNGTVTGTPNQLILSMGVQVSAASVSSALQEANQAVNRVTAALRAAGVASADIQTSGLSIQPNYRADSQVPDGYQVSEYLTATLRHISSAGAQIQAAVQAGGNAVTVDGVSLNLTDTSALLARARAAAVADARHKAAQYASAAGQQLGPVISITDQAQTQPYPFDTAAAGAAPRASVPISPGTQQLSVSITVTYALG